MKKENKLNPIATAIGTTFLISLTAGPLANAAENPFTMTELSSGGYMVAEGNCGEGKCGAEKRESEGKCGEGKCGEQG